MRRRRLGGLRFRKRIVIVPGVFYGNASTSGMSWTLRLGPWSWNSRTRTYRLDLPWAFYWVGRSGRSPRAILAVLGLLVVGAGGAALAVIA